MSAVRGGERNAADALGLAGDRRDEADQRSASIEHRSAACALVHGSGHDRLVTRSERGRACRKSRPIEPKDDEVLRRRAEPRRSVPRGEISGQHRQARRGVRALDLDGLSSDSRMRAIVGFECGQRLARRHDKRGRGRLRNGGGGGADAGGAAAFVAGAPADSGNGSKELATAITTGSRAAVCEAG